MKAFSILLALSGSQQSKYAAEVCWDLSERLGAEVLAQHVVDLHSSWEFLGHDNPGFLDSASYVNAYQKLGTSLFNLGEELAVAYAAETARRGQKGECVVDQGNPVQQIADRAKDHELVVIGHKPSGLSATNPRSQFLRLSIAEALSNDCTRPLLVIQQQVKSWSNLGIVISSEHINEGFINNSLKTARALNLQPVIVCLAAIPDMDVQEFALNLRKANPGLRYVPIGLSQTQHESFSDDSMIWSCTAEQRPSLQNNTLLVIPTRAVGDERLTVLDGAPSVFIRYLNLSSILLWPEEFTFSFLAEEQELTAKA